MLKLVISDDEGKKTVVPLVRDEITIGRKEGNTIRLTERNVSRRHARIVKRSADYVLEDLASYNGIVVNNARLVEAKPIRHGDEIRIGDYMLSILDEPGVQPAPQPQPAAPPSEPIVPLLSAPAPAMPATTPSAAPKASEVPPVPEHIRGLRLVFLAPAGVPPPVMLDRLPIVLGRSEGAEVALPFSSISREHARVFLEDDKLMIEDMGSSNGVQVNGEKAKKAQLGPGDMVQLGVVEFRVARRGDSTVVIQKAALEEKQRARRTPLGLVGAIVGGGIVVGLAVVVAFNKMNHGTPRTEGQSLAQAPIAAPVVNPPAVSPETPTPPAPTAPEAQPAAAATPTENPRPPRPPRPRARRARSPCTRGPCARGRRARTRGPAHRTRGPGRASRRGDPRPPDARIPRERRARENRERDAARAAARAAAPPRPPPAAAAPAAPPPRPAPAPTPPPASSGGGGDSNMSPMERVAQCRSSSGDETGRNTCIINALRGRASSDQELRMLAATYQVTGRTQDAIRTMRTYIQRYPQGSAVNNFNQFILRNSGN
ncbi:MAG: FHA domain-containing protein [Polyangiales bacterium]